MDENSIKKANNEVSKLIGLQGLSIGRSAAMAWIGFGCNNTEYALHLQCSFRFRDMHEILLTNNDIVEPSELLLKNPEFDYDTFKWDVQGDNRYDEWVKSLDLDFLSKLKVIATKVNTCGDVIIFFEQDIVLDVFINETVEECWRLFNRNSDCHHFVMLGSGICEYDE